MYGSRLSYQYESKFLSSSLPPPHRCLMQTWQRETRDLVEPAFTVWLWGMVNCWLSSMVVSQKENLLAKKWQLPLAPLH